MRIELLGRLRAAAGGRIIDRFRTCKAAALLAYLAFYRDQTHSRDALIELLWPEERREVGRERLRTALASLRRHLEPGPSSAPSGRKPIDSTLCATRDGVRLSSAITPDGWIVLPVANAQRWAAGVRRWRARRPGDSRRIP